MSWSTLDRYAYDGEPALVVLRLRRRLAADLRLPVFDRPPRATPAAPGGGVAGDGERKVEPEVASRQRFNSFGQSRVRDYRCNGNRGSRKMFSAMEYRAASPLAS